jgi:hypothetical protein
VSVRHPNGRRSCVRWSGRLRLSRVYKDTDDVDRLAEALGVL